MGEDMPRDSDLVLNEEETARKFHEVYERLAPNFGYETRTETREFESTTPNGKLMIAVMAEMLPLIKSSTIAKIRAGMPTREKACEHPDWGYVQYHDLMEKNINDVEGE